MTVYICVRCILSLRYTMLYLNISNVWRWADRMTVTGHGAVTQDAQPIICMSPSQEIRKHKHKQPATRQQSRRHHQSTCHVILAVTAKPIYLWLLTGACRGRCRSPGSVTFTLQLSLRQSRFILSHGTQASRALICLESHFLSLHLKHWFSIQQKYPPEPLNPLWFARSWPK